MRPHVELILEDDYVWHPAELPHAQGEAVQRNLSVDEEDGSASLRVDFRSELTRPAGRHAADTEWYVLEGEVEVGGRALGPRGYVYAARGAVLPEVRAAAGTRILLFREYGDWGFEPADESLPDVTEDVIVLDSDELEWQDAATDDPRPGIKLKLLHRNPETGFYSRLVWCLPGWADQRLEHHPCTEEIYQLSGRMTHNYGETVPRSYTFRPPWIKHGDFRSHPQEGSVAFIRSDGELKNFYTSSTEVVARNEPENYDLQTQGPVIAGLPVRSRSIGPWDGTGR